MVSFRSDSRNIIVSRRDHINIIIDWFAGCSTWWYNYIHTALVPDDLVPRSNSRCRPSIGTSNSLLPSGCGSQPTQPVGLSS